MTRSVAATSAAIATMAPRTSRATVAVGPSPANTTSTGPTGLGAKASPGRSPFAKSDAKGGTVAIPPLARSLADYVGELGEASERVRHKLPSDYSPDYIIQVIRDCHGSVGQAANRLGIQRATLHNYVKSVLLRMFPELEIRRVRAPVPGVPIEILVRTVRKYRGNHSKVCRDKKWELTGIGHRLFKFDKRLAKLAAHYDYDPIKVVGTLASIPGNAIRVSVKDVLSRSKYAKKPSPMLHVRWIQDDRLYAMIAIKRENLGKVAQHFGVDADLIVRRIASAPEGSNLAKYNYLLTPSR